MGPRAAVRLCADWSAFSRRATRSPDRTYGDIRTPSEKGLVVDWAVTPHPSVDTLAGNSDPMPGEFVVMVCKNRAELHPISPRGGMFFFAVKWIVNNGHGQGRQSQHQLPGAAHKTTTR
ncbi:hypothetical protein ZHAS_00018998 [Anopheles sinensis]|uniref:Uncharacterized protein n=1 Tax=Anopheles sinensis TaxID=74873 RepID=A0A084WL63_ANOSI|nr:hypothetical protein ZHAS_00018998 [Anopheles sinensis]